jgi:ubiquinone/menaquinone biosynthesis C-methylase UbiE
MPENAQARAAFTYNAASDFYDASPLGFWDYFGRRTIELASIPIGSRVLDVCCGAGASALPTAEAVGPTGNVIGVILQTSFWNRRGQKQFNGALATSNLKWAICSR